MKKVSLIIVNWNSNQYLKKCLESIKKYAPSYIEMIIVDNNSDQKVDHLSKTFSGLRIIKNNQNLGFGKSCNQGAKIARGEYLFFLNPDTQITKESIEILVDYLDKSKKAGAVGPKLLGGEGYYLKPPSLGQVIFFYTRLHRFFIKSKIFKKLFWKIKLGNKKKYIKHIPGAAIMVRKNVFKKIGGFDERFFLWFEDVDLSRQIRKKGYKLIYIPESEIIHEGAGSFRLLDDKVKRDQTLESLKIYCRKNFNKFNYFLFIIIMGVDKFLSWIKRPKSKFR